MGGQKNDPLITVNKRFFNKLMDDSNFLDCLKACGVDNWTGYSQAVEMFNQQEEQLDNEEELNNE